MWLYKLHRFIKKKSWFLNWNVDVFVMYFGSNPNMMAKMFCKGQNFLYFFCWWTIGQTYFSGLFDVFLRYQKYWNLQKFWYDREFVSSNSCSATQITSDTGYIYSSEKVMTFYIYVINVLIGIIFSDYERIIFRT